MFQVNQFLCSCHTLLQAAPSLLQDWFTRTDFIPKSETYPLGFIDVSLEVKAEFKENTLLYSYGQNHSVLLLYKNF